MRRREDYALSKHTLNLYAGDYERVQSLYPSRIGAAKVIREVVHDFLAKIHRDARIPYFEAFGRDDPLS